MTDEKKKVIFAASLAVVAVAALWLFLSRRSATVALDTAAPDPTATADPASNYTNYNQAPYPPAIGNPYAPQPKSSCCSTCGNGVSNGGVNNSIAAYAALMEDLNA